MAGDYPSTDFAISEDAAVRRVLHLPTGMEIVTARARRDPVAVLSTFTIEIEGSGSQHPQQEVAQAALRHLRRLVDAQIRCRAAPWLSAATCRGPSVLVPD
jgi:hypothetical protein